MIQDKIVLVTGASAGIGRETAKAFSQAGARVIVAARRKDRLEELISSLPGPAYALELDVCQTENLDTLPPEWREIDILVNNAGLSRRLDTVWEGNTEDWDQMIDTNVKGLLKVTRAALPGMLERGHGLIINIGSVSGHEVYPGGTVYCATKYAVRAITQGLLQELVDTPIRVCSLDPGAVETEFSVVRFDGDNQRASQVYDGFEPLTPEDVAEAAVWVASRPERVQITEMHIMPTAQAGATKIHRQR